MVAVAMEANENDSKEKDEKSSKSYSEQSSNKSDIILLKDLKKDWIEVVDLDDGDLDY